MGLNQQLVFKDPTHLLPTQTHPFDTPKAQYSNKYQDVKSLKKY
jgi:hypothetical protein